jgi:hypothetical protein
MNGKWFGMAACGLLLASGCAYDSVVGSGTTGSGQAFGTWGRTGYGNNYVIERGSKLHHISIIGDNNIVTVQEGVTLQKIEAWGSNNTFYVPDTLKDVRLTQVGKGNRVIMYPRGEQPPVVQPQPIEQAAPPGEPAATPASGTPAESSDRLTTLNVPAKE